MTWLPYILIGWVALALLVGIVIGRLCSLGDRIEQRARREKHVEVPQGQVRL